MSSSYLHPIAQRQRILGISQSDQDEAQRQLAVYQAYQQLGASDYGQIILDDMVARVLLGQCLNERDMGKQDIVRDILRLMREAPERIAQLERSLHDGTA